MAATSNFVDTPGLRIHYLQAGRGTPVVLLHGFPQTSYQWRHQIAALADAGYACFAPDNRGFGRTDKDRVRISRGLLARDVARFMDALGLESAHVVGHDWGGIIAYKFVADHPERVRSVTLVDTLCTVWAPRAVHGYWFKAEGLAEEFFARHHRAFIDAMFGGGDGGAFPGRPESAFGFRPGTRPRPDWIDAEALDHYRNAIADPDSHFATIQYYRYGLPFHAIEADGSLTPLNEREVGEMWLHPDGLEAHPRYDRYMDFGPEDRATRFPRPALWLHS
ncbi:MAG: alpha/beta hydrolase, partial [Acidimicrobiia bacterium]|nr:alpha/beta hydrolase [Acidimicrobiia bacterium]